MNPRNPFGRDHLKTLSELYRHSRPPLEATLATLDGTDGLERLMDQALEAQRIVGRTRAIDLALITTRGLRNHRKSGQ